MIYRNKACPLPVNQRQRRDYLGEPYMVCINQGDLGLLKKKKLISGAFVSFLKGCLFLSADLLAFTEDC